MFAEALYRKESSILYERAGNPTISSTNGLYPFFSSNSFKKSSRVGSAKLNLITDFEIPEIPIRAEKVFASVNVRSTLFHYYNYGYSCEETREKFGTETHRYFSAAGLDLRFDFFA